MIDTTLILAALMAATPQDSNYPSIQRYAPSASYFEANDSLWVSDEPARCAEGPEHLRGVCAMLREIQRLRAQPDTIGYWLNRRMDYNWCNSCSPLNEWGSRSCTTMACTGREIIDTVWVFRKK